MNARQLVNQLLEADMSPYDRDDPLDKPDVADYPPGFTIYRGTDRIIFKFDPRPLRSNQYQGEYRMTNEWVDEYTGKPRSVDGFVQPVSLKYAEKWRRETLAKYLNSGWKLAE